MKKTIGLILLISLCLFGCGESADPKLETVEEIGVAFDELIDYETFGLEKVKDDFENTFIIRKEEEKQHNDFDDYMRKIYAQVDEMDAYLGEIDVETNECVFWPSIIYSQPDEKSEVMCYINTSIYYSHKRDLIPVQEMLISDGTNVIKIEEDTISQENDFSFDSVDGTITAVESGDIASLVNSENNLKIRMVETEFTTTDLPDFELTKEQSDHFKQLLKWYIEVKEQCNTKKVHFPI